MANKTESEIKEEFPNTGLDESTNEKDWPGDKLGKNSASDGGRPIDALRPGTKLHDDVLAYLQKRLMMSERAMAKFYGRWSVAEKKIQAYIDLPDYEKMLKQMNNSGQPPKVTNIVVPYSWATIATIRTYLIHTFAGREPIWQLSSYNDDGQKNLRRMEQLLQYNCNHVRMVNILSQYFQDGELYGVGIVRLPWETRRAKRTVWTQQAKSTGLMGILMPNKSGGATEWVKTREEKITFQGTGVYNQDPYMFFPDPRVPMKDVNKRGEFVFWRTYEGKHTLKAAEAAGDIKWVDAAPKSPKANSTGTSDGNSDRSLISGGMSQPGKDSVFGKEFYQIDQGSIEIIPSELGLGDSDVPEKWMFAIANNGQIIQAEPYDADHGMHPCAIIEPYTLGYGFGQPSMADYLGPLQDTISWFVNSHIMNVRTALNNMFVVDPSMIEMQDMKNPEPGKLIRLKRAAYGQDVRQAVSQLNVADVTSSHTRDMQQFMNMGDMLSSVTDNLRGLQDSGGRKTATEVRTSMEAASSRLASHARLLSSQGICDMGEQMCMNYQQYLEDDFQIQVQGEAGVEESIHITPQTVVGDYVFPSNDGTLPLDRVALLDVWKEIWMAVVQNPTIGQGYDQQGIFNYIAQLSGAQGLNRFKIAPQATQQVEQGVQAGNMVPVGTMNTQAPAAPSGAMPMPVGG